MEGSAMMNPNVFIGRVRILERQPNLEVDDDELLEETPEEVVQILGFDPLDYEELRYDD
jgi:hypothetical protein